MTLVLTGEEFAKLQAMVTLYIGEGFTRYPTASDISIVRKLRLLPKDCWPYEDEYAEAFN